MLESISTRSLSNKENTEKEERKALRRGITVIIFKTEALHRYYRVKGLLKDKTLRKKNRSKPLKIQV